MKESHKGSDPLCDARYFTTYYIIKLPWGGFFVRVHTGDPFLCRKQVRQKRKQLAELKEQFKNLSV